MKLKLFGTFTLSATVDPDISLVSAQKLVALLCMRPNVNRPRAELAHFMWPDFAEEIARNRLRTALVQARDALDPHAKIEGDKQVLRIEPSDFTVDLWEARALWRKASVTANDAEEEPTLLRLLATIHDPFLAGFSDSWIFAERQKWRSRTREALLRNLLTAEQRQDYKLAIASAEELLRIWPFDEQAWKSLLQLYAEQGRQSEICDRFTQAIQAFQSRSGGSFSPALKELAASMNRGTAYSIASQGRNRDIITRTFEQILATAPEVTLPILGTNQFFKESVRNPNQAKELLERALVSNTPFTDDKFKCLANIITVYSMLQQDKEVRKCCEELLAGDADSSRRCQAANSLAFVFFKVRDWESAYFWGKEALRYAEEIQDVVGVQLARAQMATFDWHLGEYEAALSTYEDVIENLQKSTEFRARLAAATVELNSGIIYFILADLDSAKRWINTAVIQLEAAEYETMLCLARPFHGTLEMIGGNEEGGFESVSKGLKYAHKMKDERFIQIGLDCVALALIERGKYSEGLAVLESVKLMRERTKFTRALAEQYYVDRLCLMCADAKPNGEWLAFKSRGELVEAVLDALAPFGTV